MRRCGLRRSERQPEPRLDHRPPRAPGTRNWIITADEEQMHQLRERRARPPGFYTRARWAHPQHEPDQEQGTQP